MNDITIELWCPGPSLVPHATAADVVVVVNRAMLAAREEPRRGLGPFVWWVANDAKLIRSVMRPLADECPTFDAILTSELSTYETVMNLRKRETVPVLGDTALRAVRNQDFGKFAKSKYIALALCFQLGAKRVEVYGDDMLGEDDWDGPNERASRDETRWAGERAETAKSIAWMAKSGCEVVHMVWDKEANCGLEVAAVTAE